MRYVTMMALFLFVHGCNKPKPEADPDFDKYVAGAKEKLGKLDEIKAALAATPPVTEEKLDPDAKKGHWTIIATDQFDGLGKCFSEANICGPEWTLLESCQEDSKKTAEEVAEEYGGTKELKECSELKLLAVVRQVSFSKPSADMSAKTYSPGSFVGEVLVFDIDSAKYLGGFRATATTPESLDKVPQGLDVDNALIQTIKQSFIESVKLKLGDSQRG